MTSIDESPAFSALLREYRIQAELTQEALAELASLSPRSIQKLERGETLPYAVTRQRLANALGLRGERRAEFMKAGDRPPKPTPTPLIPPRGIDALLEQLPRGQVTILLADVSEDGSDEDERFEASSALPPGARIDEVLQRLAAPHGGVMLPGSSEESQRTVVFADARNALITAVTTREQLAGARDSDGFPIRMAVHSGRITDWAKDFSSSPTLVEVGRLLAAAQGSQILVSSVAAEVLGDALPPGFKLAALGERRLGDLARPERVFVIERVGLPSPTVFPTKAVTLESHYEAVTSAIVDGRVVLFLGEQINLCDRGVEPQWQPGSPGSIPTGNDLARHLAQQFGYPDVAYEGLVRVAQYVAVMSGSGPLYDALHRVFDIDYQPNAVHKFAAGLPSILRERGAPVRYPLIVTANYDDTLERAFARAGEPFDLVVYMAEGDRRGKFWHQTPDGKERLIDRPNKYPGLTLDERPVILKIHGAVDRTGGDRDSFVVTEDDHLDYLTRSDLSNLIPVTLAARLRKSHYLFLGYSLRDWNLRVILHRLWGEQRLTYKSWSAQPAPDALEQELWRKRDVEVVGAGLEDYVAELGDHFFVRAGRE